MRILQLGRGKTGSLVAEVARERGHSVHNLTERENVNGSALTPPFLTSFDVIIDFTTPEAVVYNMRSCLAAGAKMVVGTTGWYDKLPEITSLVERRGGALLYSTNFSVGMQIFLQLAEHFGRTFCNPLGYKVGISETHHESKVDSPSGTAKTLQQVLSGTGVETEITSHRTGDAHGTHEIQAHGAPDDKIVLLHEAFSRKGFADGAVRGAEWLAERTGVYDYRDIYSQL